MQRRRPRAANLTAGLCGNTVHGSTRLTTNGWEVHKNELLDRSP